MATGGNRVFAGRVTLVTSAGSRTGLVGVLAVARGCGGVVLAYISEQGNRERVRMIEEADGRDRRHTVACTMNTTRMTRE